MYTYLKNSKWFVTVAAVAGLTLSAASSVMAHGGGGGGSGGGMGHPSSGGMSARSFSSGKSLAAKNLSSSPLRTSKLNASIASNSSLKSLKNTTSLATLKTPSKTPIVLNKLGGLNSVSKVSAVGTGTGTPASSSIINKVGANKVAQLPQGPVQIPPGGNNGGGPVISNPKGGCSPYPGNCWGPFGGLGLYPYLYGFGGYGGIGGNSGYGGGYGGSSYASAGSTPLVDDSSAPVEGAPVATIATTTATPAATVPGVDLQLVDVRMLDNGDASQQIGPRYRVAFRNAGSAAVDHAFNVAVIAADDSNLSANLPVTESRITSVATGDVTYVDLRLPAKAFEMGPDSHSEFSKLFVFVDSHGEVNDTNRDNNTTGLDRIAVQPAT
jgi:hypothetical protein